MASAFNNNAWYQLTESRVDFNSSWYASGNLTYFAAKDPKGAIYWQIQFVEDGIYQIRNKDSPKKQLATCFDATEKDDSNTVPCLLPSSGDNSQKWRISTWPDGTYRFSNVGNGTLYNLDVHPGNPPFMSGQTAAQPKQPGQHWMFSSLSAIDDGAWSTTVTEIPTPSSSSSSASRTRPASNSATRTSTSTSTSTPSSSPSLSGGASAGIGIGVALAVIALLALGFFLFRRRRRRYRAVELDDSSSPPAAGKGSHAPAAELAGPPGYNKFGAGEAQKVQEVWTPPAELQGEMRLHELGGEGRR